MSSPIAIAIEVEIGTMYINAKESVPAEKILTKMSNLQPSTPIETDNSATHSVATKNI